MFPSQHHLIQPGTKLLVGQELLGAELYAADDPEVCEAYLGNIVTAKKIFEDTHNKTWMIDIEEIPMSHSSSRKSKTSQKDMRTKKWKSWTLHLS